MHDSYVATGANYGVASVLLGWSKSVCNPKMGIRRLDRPQKLLHSFQGDQHLERTQQAGRPAPIHISLKWNALGCHMLGSKHPLHSETGHKDWLDHGW
jgi:hypothetical protein